MELYPETFSEIEGKVIPACLPDPDDDKDLDNTEQGEKIHRFPLKVSTFDDTKDMSSVVTTLHRRHPDRNVDTLNDYRCISWWDYSPVSTTPEQEPAKIIKKIAPWQLCYITIKKNFKFFKIFLIF